MLGMKMRKKYLAFKPRGTLQVLSVTLLKEPNPPPLFHCESTVRGEQMKSSSCAACGNVLSFLPWESRSPAAVEQRSHSCGWGGGGQPSCSLPSQLRRAGLRPLPLRAALMDIPEKKKSLKRENILQKNCQLIMFENIFLQLGSHFPK